MLDLAIVGGGPGGLMSAWYLKKKLGDLCRVTIFEASDRLGGKVLTGRFDSAPAIYEAGVAEIYDYSMTGPDPLRELIQHFGLQTIQMDAEQVLLDGELLNDVPACAANTEPRRRTPSKRSASVAAEMVSPIEYYEGVGAHDNEHPWAYITAEELLDREVDDATAKRFFKVMARSDIATESHNTNGLNALKNFVMDVDGYIGLYSIQNGNEQLIECLQSEVDADIQLNHRVLKVGKTAAGRDQLNMMNGKGPETRDFDLVLMCLPHSWLATMGWDGEGLRQSMVKHVSYFDRPAHYLRVSILFDSPVLGRQDPGLLVHVGSLRRLLCLQRGLPPRRRPSRRAQLADRGFRRARFRQSRRQGADRCRAQIVAGFAWGRARALHRGQDPSLAVVGQRIARRHAGARCDDQPPARTRSNILAWFWSATICSIRRSTACSIPPMRRPISS